MTASHTTTMDSTQVSSVQSIPRVSRSRILAETHTPQPSTTSPLRNNWRPSGLLDGFGRGKPQDGKGLPGDLGGTESDVRMSESVARGVVLGPFEALCAEVMWFRESVPIAEAFRGASLVRFAVPRLPRVSWQVQRKILTANLLYGDLDVSAAGPWGANFLDHLLMKNGINVSQREWIEDFLPPEIISPLRRFRMNDAFHVDPTTRFVPPNAMILVDSPTIPEPVVHAVVRTLKRVGYESFGGFGPSGTTGQQDVRSYAKESLAGLPWPPHAGDNAGIAMSSLLSVRAARIAVGIHQSIERSVVQSKPFLSVDALAPAWVHNDGSEPQFEVVKAVFELPDFPSLPRTFLAVSMLDGDPRLTSLRSFVDWATNRILTCEATAVQQVRRETERIASRKRRRERIAGLTEAITYVSLPVGGLEAISGMVGPGLGLASLGALSQGISSILTRNSVRHWSSL